MEKLEHDIQHLNAAQRSLFNELAITGLPITDTTSSKGAVYAALKLLDDWLLVRDILHVRKMRQKPSSEPQNPTISNTHAEESPTMDLQSSSQPNSGDTRPRITPFIVAFSSHKLALSPLNAKIKMGKMHTSKHRVISTGKCHTSADSFSNQYK